MRRKPPTVLRVLILFLYLVSSLFNPTASAAALDEYAVKAAFLYQFTKFVEWPETSETAGSFNVCILGNNPFEKVILQLENTSIKNRQVKVQVGKQIREISACQILFISKSEEPRISHYLSEAEHTPVLTVGETKGFLEKGGIINFLKEGNKIRFTINQKRALKTGIKISSKLLTVASKVVTS